VLRSTEVHPAFCDLSPQCLYARTHHIILICYGMCVYIKAFEAARSNNTAHHIAFDVSCVVWDSWLRKLFILANSIQPSLYGGLGVFCTLSRASFVVDPHVVDAHFADFTYPIYVYGQQMRCKHISTNVQLYDKASGLLNFKATMATGC
jgi:hypothetical protein